MAASYTYPVVITQTHGGLFTGILLEEDHPSAIGTSADGVVSHLREYLAWVWQERPWMDEPDLVEPRVIDVEITAQPEYRMEKNKVYPCSERIPLRLPCVSCRHEGGLYLAILPTLGVRFNYYEKAALRKLAAHFALAEMAGKNPLELARYLSVASCTLHEIVIVLKRRPKTRRPTVWHEDPSIETLASVAEPLTSGGTGAAHAHAYMRDAEVNDLIERLRARRGSVLLVGDPGVGKTTILTAAARRMELHARREGAHDSHPLWVTNAHRIIAGMRFLGQWQARCERLFKELSEVGGILCVENLLDLVRTGGEGPLDSIAAFMAPYMSRGDLTVVAEATPPEVDVCRRLLPGFADLFHVLSVNAFSASDAKTVLRAVAETAARNLHLDIEAGVWEATYRLFSRFAPYAAFPGQAVHFLTDCLEAARERKASNLTTQKVVGAFARRSGLPETFLRDEVIISHAEVVKAFTAEIIGQPGACRMAADLVTRFKAGMCDPDRPIGVLIFCGPTGVGKTALARRLSAFFFGHGDESDRLIRLDMSEYGTPYDAHRLVCDPDGSPSLFIKRIRRQPFSLVLLDEVEKAHPLVFDVLMGVFDEGRLTDPYGRATTFRSAIIVMTSNLGATPRGSLGFGEPQPAYEDQVMQFFRPEFYNRIDAVVTFNPLSNEVVRQIAEKELGEITQREGLRAYGINLRWASAVVDYLAQTGFDARYGARPLQRAIERAVVTPLARLLAENPGTRNAILQVDMGAGGPVIILDTQDT